MSERYERALSLANQYLGEDNSQAINNIRKQVEQLELQKSNITKKFKQDIGNIDKKIQNFKVQLSKLGDIDLADDSKD